MAKKLAKKYLTKADMIRLIGFMDDILKSVNPKSRIADQADLAKAIFQIRLGCFKKKKD
jgi:hypothetical protein